MKDLIDYIDYHQRERVLPNIISLYLLGFLVFSCLIGGDAFNGKIENDRYFVGQLGRYTEVPQFIFEVSKLYALSYIIGIPAFGAAMFFQRRRP